MRILMVAPPGAGKGTQAVRLAEHYGIAHLASGEVLRQEIAAGTALGARAAAYVAEGDLVPDEMIIELFMGPVLSAAEAGGYVLDGFPRTLVQAEAAYDLARQRVDVTLQAVVHLEVGRDELRRRLLARAEGRSDDNAAVIDHRLAVYDSATAPLLDFYRGRDILLSVPGDQPVEQVTLDVVAGLDRLSAHA